MQRSGSGWFETLLNNHTNVSSNGEIFSVKERRDNISSILKTMDKVYNLDWFTSASKNECSAAVGFKWMLNQVKLAPFLYGKIKLKGLLINENVVVLVTLLLIKSYLIRTPALAIIIYIQINKNEIVAFLHWPKCQ